MLFTTDQQTLDDLNIIGKRGSESIYNMFNHTRTRNGAALLEEMFRYPLSDRSAINERSAIFKHFAEGGAGFPFTSDLFDAAEYYLSITDERTRIRAEQKGVVSRLAGAITEDIEYKNLLKGLIALLEILQTLDTFINAGQSPASPPLPAALLSSEANALLSEENLAPLLKQDLKARIPQERMAAFDDYLRFRHRRSIRVILQFVYHLDVYAAVAKVALDRGFCFPTALAPGQGIIRLQEVYHPQVKNAIANSLDIAPQNHILFLTGANMAGKSTFMKTIGIALFLSHMGFPIAARQVEFSVMDGIYTTINLPDDLGMGASHFYAEVLRTKKIAKELSLGKNLFVIFDELFRGTNVKDAYEATIAIASAFAARPRSVFIISTHIIEAGEVLKEKHDTISFIYLPTRMDGNKPVYTYKIGAGITADRHGMIIVRNEGILDLLKNDSFPTEKDTPPATDHVFVADQQTLNDLNLTGKYRSGSIYSLFNKVVTRGGEKLLDEMFHRPLTDANIINRRSHIFIYFQRLAFFFPISRAQFTIVEDYLLSGATTNRLTTTFGILRKRLMAGIVKDESYAFLQQGVETAIAFIQMCKEFINRFDVNEHDNPIEDELQDAKRILSDPRLAELPSGSLSWLQISRYHQIFGHDMHTELGRLCEIFCYFDLAIAVSNVAREKGFSYAHALSGTANHFRATNLRHPALEKAIGNTLILDDKTNVLFLTGANMAGKSTLMKSFGISIYLAHMGFPVAANEMVFSVKNGLYSSINVPDNLNLGYSHFYAEVQRVKQVAEEVSRGKDLVVIFDELFKGTNVKDAYDATLAVTEAFATYRNCSFIISTHIIEVGEELKKYDDHIQFSFLPTLLESAKPTYTYRLVPGITQDRQGMMIIVNEGILDLLRPLKDVQL